MISYNEFKKIYEETTSGDIATVDSKIFSTPTKRQKIYDFLKKRKLKKSKL